LFYPCLANHLRDRAGAGRSSVSLKWVGYHVYLRRGTSMCWHIKTRLDSEPVAVDLTTIVVHSYNCW